MTVIRGKVWPDNEFPTETFAYYADRDAVHDFGTPLPNEREVRQRVKSLKYDPQTYRLRFARYRLVEIEEIDCIGTRPELQKENQ